MNTIGANNGEARVHVQTEVEVSKQRRAVAVAEGDIVETQHRRRDNGRLRESAVGDYNY